jgi:hypothetical protein
MIDDCFTVVNSKWGTWSSFDADGKQLVTALGEQECIDATRFYLKGLQEGFKKVAGYESVVGGKL